jgi:hypothetical protein
VKTLFRVAEPVLSRHGEMKDSAGLEHACQATIVDADDQWESFLREHYPGAYLATLCSVNLEMDLPGPVIESNAESENEGRLRWEISPFEAVLDPVEIYAECRVQD